MEDTLKMQIDFLLEIDKIKEIFRHTRLFNNSRYENDAEHSWHLAVMAIVLSEYSNEPIDINKVIKMVLIHDIVEIDSGDYIVYTDKKKEKEEQEKKAAERIFGLLPERQGKELISLWQEFEERKTAEAKFAAAIDRLEPILQNYYTNAHAWEKNNIKAEQIYEANQHIKNGSEVLWKYVKEIIEECITKGLIS